MRTCKPTVTRMYRLKMQCKNMNKLRQCVFSFFFCEHHDDIYAFTLHRLRSLVALLRLHPNLRLVNGPLLQARSLVEQNPDAFC